MTVSAPGVVRCGEAPPSHIPPTESSAAIAMTLAAIPAGVKPIVVPRPAQTRTIPHASSTNERARVTNRIVIPA
jgi:hypothetical protein